MQQGYLPHPSSYRDPSGFLFYREGTLYRQVNKPFGNEFEKLIKGGLYDHLSGKGDLISHEAISANLTGREDWYATLKPSPLPFISYPYEWSFGMLRDAALLTLSLARQSMEYGMMLKDASAYNVQFHNGRMVFIDSLSFETYKPEQPWIAYRQFCEHFFAPLALMHYLQLPLQELLLAWPDGIPLNVTGKLLPTRSKFNLNSFLHLHLHGSVARRQKDKAQPKQSFSPAKLKNLLRSLEEAIDAFELKAKGVWSDYYDEAGQRAGYLEAKQAIVSRWLQHTAPGSVIDIGANEGAFSLLASGIGARVISTDMDHYSVDRLYKKIRSEGQKNIHPLVMDLAKPSPAIGANNRERQAFSERANADMVLALALVHHLAVGRNLPFADIARFCKSLGRMLVIEFIPRSDEKLTLMLQQRQDDCEWYNRENFLAGFSDLYRVVAEEAVGTTGRILFLMQPF
ncbi:MAG TPA: class I SAM-dependent methyltransferase [Flavisolibacter sp.]|nr:class I SAM-dependent methyltransferase [Flavisolibacter sp.]